MSGVTPLPCSTCAPAPYRSTISKCVFTADANASSFIGFVSGWAVNGVGIYGCTFADNTGNTGTSLRYGIGGYDFGVRVDKYAGGGGSTISSKFYNLNNGVELNGANGTPTSAIVRNCLFDNNNTGVDIKALHAPQVQVNTFKISNLNTLPHKMGLYLATSSGYGVTYNSFSPKPGARFTVGAVISNTGSDRNVVAKNDYNTLWVAGTSNYLNRNPDPLNVKGLQFLCNTHSNTIWDMSATGSGSNLDEGMCDFQGSSSMAAGNTFTSSGYYNVFNDPGSVHSLNYYAASGQVPATMLGISVFSGGANACGTNEYPNPNGSGPTRDPNGRLGKKGMRIAYFLSDPEGMQYRDSLYLELSDWHSAYSDLLKTDLLIQDGDTMDANTVYNGIVTNDSLTGVEATEFSYWGRKLMDIKLAQLLAGVTPDSLTATQVTMLAAVADSAQMWARDRARGWLHIYDGRTFTTDMVFPTDTSAGGGSARMTAAHNTIATASKLFYNVSPNPASDELQVSYQKGDATEESFVLIDVRGRVVVQSTITGQSGTRIVDLRGLQSGIYFYRIMNGKTLKQSGKISKQ